MENKKNLMNYIKIFFISMLFVVMAYFLFGELYLPSDSQKNKFECKDFLIDWTWIKEDGTKEKISIPGTCDAERNELVTVEGVVPSYVEENMYICIRSSRQDMNVYIDGELRHSYSTEDTRLFGSTSAVSYLFIEFNEEDAGKKIRIEAQSDSTFSGVFYPIYYGDIMGIWERFFEDYGTELVVALLTILLALVTIGGSIILNICYHKKIELEHLGWGVLIAGVWLLSNSVFRQMIFPNVSVISDIAFFMVMLMAFPFLLYLNEIQKRRYEKIYSISGLVLVVVFIICTVLHITRQEDFADTIAIMAVANLICITLIIITIVMDIRNKLIKEYKLVAIGMAGSCVAATIQLSLYFQKSIPFSGVIIAIGLIFLLLVSTISTIKAILDMDREKQRAISASKEKERFLASISHEIRTPINAVIGMNSMILRESKEEHIKEYALDVHNAGQNLLALINDILDLSKVESGKLDIIPVEYDLSSMVHDISTMISIKAKNKGLKLNVIIDEDLPSRLLGDELRIRQILINLLNNAVKYTDEGGVYFRVSGIQRADTVLLKFVIEDTGIGIKDEDIPKLFSEYERIEEIRNRNIEGTGLGINISNRLLTLMDSKLDVESIYGEGSKFSFELEQCVVDSEQIGDLEKRIHRVLKDHTYDVSFIAPDANILVVDDNPINLKVVENLLKETKVKVDSVISGTECIKMIKDKKYHIIFLDHMMPEMDGIETLHRIKDMNENINRDTPVIALTANAVSGAKEMYISEGFDGFLSKPVAPDKIEKLIKELLPYELLIQSEDIIEMEELVEDDDLPQVDGISWEFAKLYIPDRDALLDAVRIFYDEIETEANALNELFINRDTVGYRIKVHAMKNSAALIGSVPLSGLAKVLEYAARDNDRNTMEKLHSIFLKEWRGYKNKLDMFAN